MGGIFFWTEREESKARLWCGLDSGVGVEQGMGKLAGVTPQAAAGDGSLLFRWTLRAQDGVVVWWEVREHFGLRERALKRSCGLRDRGRWGDAGQGIPVFSFRIWGWSQICNGGIVEFV
jgi:hypothetical protein